MIDVSLAMQDAIVAALRADAGVSALVGTRIYDRVPMNAERPYVSLGPAQVTEDRIDCIDGSEVFQQVTAFSEAPGFAECKTIANAIRSALHKLQANQGGLSFEIEHRFTNIFRASDGLSSQGVLSFRALIDQ
jgi:hypothetical protein